MKSYTFHVSIPGTGRTWRKIELPGGYTLSHLHHAIQKAFRFDNDHLYSFFMSGKAWDSESEYRLPHGMGPWEEGKVLSAEEMALDAERRAKAREAREKEMIIQRERLRKEVIEYLIRTGSEPSEENIQDLIDFMPEPGLRIKNQAGNVLTTGLGSFDLKRKQTFMYLFDHGHEWRFKVRVHAINENANPDVEYPRIVESVGTPPSQYRSWR